MKLPNGEGAFIDSQKLVGYSLDPNHTEGKHKARVFQSALELGLDDVEELKTALLNAIQTQDAIPTTNRNPYGQKYIIDFVMSRSGKQATIRSAWIIRDTEDFPRLITCYIL
jgi:hypothetical protein